VKKSRLMPILAFVMGKVLGIPCIKSFTIAECKEFITKEGFDFIDTHSYFSKPPRLFVVARKSE